MADNEESLNSKIHNFALNHIGQKVGKGDCYAFVDRALREAGAKSAPDYGKITATTDYVWGELINLADVRAGDVLQFRNHKIIITTTTKIIKKYPKGNQIITEEIIEKDEKTLTRGHHSAIVSSNNGKGNVTILEQHVHTPGKKTETVQQNQIHVSNNTVKQPKKVNKQGNTTIEIQTTIEINVEGTIWAYRPQQSPVK